MATVTQLPILDPAAAFARGGFGAVFEDPRDATRCIKVLNEPLAPEASRQITRLIDVVRWARPSDVEIFTSRFAWPVEAFGEPDAITGFAMQRAPSSTEFDLKSVGRTERKTLRAQYLMNRAYWKGIAVQSEQPDVGLSGRVEVLLDLASALTVLHESGLSYGDVSSNNVAVNLTSTPQVFLFDADSILTVSERAANPLHTPDWQVGDKLDPIETDRARFALFATRLFAQVPNLTPDGHIDELLPESVVVLLPALNELHRTGSIDSFEALRDGLRHRRSSSAGRQAFDRAVESQFARRVIAERIHAVTPADQKMVAFAENQLLYEVAYARMSGKQRRQAVVRESLNRAGFTLDVPPVIRLSEPPKTQEELKDLVHLAMFEDIAGHLVNEGLGTLEQHSWLARAVQHALVEANDAELQVKTDRGRLTVRAWWPADPIVNVMKLTITCGDLDYEADMRRGDASHQMEREVVIDLGGDVTVALRAGSESPSGTVVWDPDKAGGTHRVPPLVEPSPHRTLPPPTVGATVGAVLDPVALREREILERLERERLEIARKRRNARRLAIWSICTIVAGLLALPAARFARDLVVDDPAAVVDGAETQGPDLRAGPGYVAITMAPRTAADNEENLVYKVDWGEHGTRQPVLRRSSIRTTPQSTYEPKVTAITSTSASEIPVRGSLLVADPERDPREFGLPASSAIGLTNDGIYVHLGVRNADSPSTVAVRFTRLGDATTRRIEVPWESKITLPINSPGTWYVSIVVSDREAYQFPAVTLNFDHPATLDANFETENT